jgi:uncharacterized protein with NAD-binding domain and iron-sulfur cluster
MRRKVIVVGGGVAGLTAAHELVERGFDVELYERRPANGGKAASAREALTAYPREHGFRFFPGWYRHLPDTLRQIPYQQNSRMHYDGRSVLDNLVTIKAGRLAWYAREPIPAPMHLPRELSQATSLVSFLSGLYDLGLTPTEVLEFFNKMAQFVAMPESRRLQELEKITWWDYLEADAGKSQAYRDLISATTRLLVAAKATEASAYTIGHLALRTLSDAVTNVDRVLNGPTSEVWIEPWVDFLTKKGVVFHQNWELDSIDMSGGEGRIRALRLSHINGQHLRRLHRLADSMLRALDTVELLIAEPLEQRLAALERMLGDADSVCEIVELMSASASPSSRTAQASVKRAVELAVELRKRLGTINDHLLQAQKAERERSAAPAAQPSDTLSRLRVGIRELRAETWVDDSPLVADADYFVFALPVEQMAYYVNRSAMLTYHDPSLERIVQLARHTDWMGGIQFYLKQSIDISEGHLVCMDSEWSLTAIEQTQFWPDIRIPKEVRSIVSVDVAAWDRKGRFNQKEAFSCTAEEVAEEVWQQLKAALNRDSKPRVIDDAMLIEPTARGRKKSGASESPLQKKWKKGVNFALDDSIADRYDRKKQAAYEAARGAALSGARGSAASASTPRDPFYVWGRDRRNFNIEPLLINRVGTRALRPTHKTQIPNMFLAADYVLTATDLACMEAANEAAKRAVNALLDTVGFEGDRCDVYEFAPVDLPFARLIDLIRLAGGNGISTNVVKTAGRIASGFFGLASNVTDSFMNRRKRP